MSVDDIKVEEATVQTELRSILDAGLQGTFTINRITIEKTAAEVDITNGVLVIPCRVRYKKFGLSDFARKPGKKQMEQREDELRRLVPIEALKGLNHYEVGVSRFEAQERSAYAVFCYGIEIVA